MTGTWQFWAFGSALFAALTAILAKLGVAAIPSDLATLIRTVVVLALLAGVVLATGQTAPLGAIPGRTWAFLILSGLATGASWLCYFRALKLGDVARVAPVDKLSVVMVAILGAVLLREAMPVQGWIGVALIGLGVLLTATAR